MNEVEGSSQGIDVSECQFSIKRGTWRVCCGWREIVGREWERESLNLHPAQLTHSREQIAVSLLGGNTARNLRRSLSP